MGRKNRNTNIKILQRQIQELASNGVALAGASNGVALAVAIKNKEKNENKKKEEMGGKIPNSIQLNVVQLETKPKKRGLKKDELINTKRLLTM